MNAPAAYSVELTRGPYLQNLTADRVTIVWNTDVAAPCSLAFRPPGGSVSIIPGGSGRVCSIAVTDLFPGARYAYTARAGGVALGPESGFRTDDPEAPFTFLVVGDSGSGSADQYDVAEEMADGPADLILHTGDMVYEATSAAEYDIKFFAPYRDLIRRLVFWPCLGEEDVRDDGRVYWRDAFETPANNPAHLEEYYSFDYGNAHFVVLDTTRSAAEGSAMGDFLDDDLASSDATWNFVVFHKTIYASRVVPPPARRYDLAPVMDRHHVDVAFSGDIHVYERSKSIAGDVVVPDGAGTTYITTGGGGRSVGQTATSAFTAYTEGAFHFVRIAVDGGDLRLEMVRANGSVRDVFTLAKDPTPRCGDGHVNHRSEVCDGSDDIACPGDCRGDCTCPPVCGDGIVNRPIEDCDLGDDAACPGRCLPTCQCDDPAPLLEIEPVADTHIDADSGAATAQGAAVEVVVDAEPERVVYLKFDLRGVELPVGAATLTLYGTSSTDDGGIVYPVADSSWNEVAGLNGPGLRWIDVDTNDDGTVAASDASPYVPDFGHPIAAMGAIAAGTFVTLDVTAAFQNGPALYTLAIRTETIDRGGFASREVVATSQRPLLRLALATSSSCRSAADCADGLPCTEEYCHPIARICQEIVHHAVCNDGLYCDGAERCDSEIGCVEGPFVVACDDGVACTIDACDEASDGCRYVRDDRACDDGDVCTTDACDASAGCRHGDSGLCGPIAFETLPVADTFIQADAEATWDHGAAPLLEIDASPERIIYLKFVADEIDLPVRRAVLTLQSLDGTPDGGTIYPVDDSSWIEGNRNGETTASASGPGLKWVDVDTNASGGLGTEDTSPYLPVFDRPIAVIGRMATGDRVAVDVTTAFVGGPGTYSLAIRSRDINKGAYGSRENGDVRQRPSLRLEYTCVSDGDCDDGSACTVDRCDAGTRCIHTPTDALCDDAVGCTRDVCDLATRACLHVADDAFCDNGLYCDGAERCEVARGCVAGATVACGDAVPCTVDACDEHADRCTNQADDHRCNDSDGCTTDLCVAATGCTHLDNGLCTPVAIELPAVADTYIEKGAQATWDHGRAALLRADAEPLRLVYIKFDLGAVSRPVLAAKLRLYVSDPGPDGGVVYPVGDASWVEGDRDGATTTSAGGPGLKWVSVDTNGDGLVDARDTSPWVPAFSRPLAAVGNVTTGQVVRVDVTAALTGGAGLYALALRTAETNGVFFAAREATVAAQRPALELLLAPIPPCATDAECDDGVACTADRCVNGGCSHAADDAVCDDGIACTYDRCDPAASGCRHTAIDSVCDNGIYCDGAERCVAGAGCVAGASDVCDDGIACTVDACDEDADRCVRVADASACNDGDRCTTDACVAGTGCAHAENGLCTPTALELSAVADTYIEKGAQATWDHGRAALLKADAEPMRLVYIKFDLGAVSRPILAATLRLIVSDPGPDGGVVYPVDDASWVEGDRDGATTTSAGGPGLKWVDVDTNGDGLLDARDASPWAPLFGQPLGEVGSVTAGQVVRVDVTAALQGGPGMYALALRTAGTNGVFFGAREATVATQRPALELLLAPEDPCDADADCDDGIACTADRCVSEACVHTPIAEACDDGSGCTTNTCVAGSGCAFVDNGLCAPVMIALGPTGDTFIEAGAQATWDHGAASSAKVDAAPVRLMYLKFDLAAVTGTVTAATLELRCTNGSPDGGTLYPVADSGWIEGNRTGADSASANGPGLAWVDVDTNGDGALSGADASAWMPVFAQPIAALGAVAGNTTIRVDVTAAVRDRPGAVSFALRNTNTNGAYYVTREATTTSARPVLRLQVTPILP